MKRIEFVAPVASMRGKFGIKQGLVYADANNPAFDAPAGKQYARNYQPVFIGNKRSKDGVNYFSLKTKSATNISAESKRRMAILGGAAAWYNACLKSVIASTQIKNAYNTAKASGTIDPLESMRKFTMDILMPVLRDKREFATIGSAHIANPWYAGATGEKTPVSTEILVKFWLQLGCNYEGNAPIVFYIDGQKGISFDGKNFSALVGYGESVNILNLTITADDKPDFVQMDGAYVVSGTTYQMQDSVPTLGQHFSTTTVEPA